MSSGYKDHIAQKGVKDETYTGDGVALFRISGTSQHNSKAIQVDAVCSLLDVISFYLHSLVSRMMDVTYKLPPMLLYFALHDASTTNLLSA